MKTLLILDAVNLLFRAYHAIKPMTNAKGETTHALFGFIRSVNKLRERFSPEYIVAVFDGPDNKKKRTEIYKEYKSHRKGMPEDLVPQLEKAKEFCGPAGIPMLCIPGVEADDTIGAVARFGQRENLKTYICSSDKDLCSLVSESVFLIHPHKDNRIVDIEGVKELFGVAPEQIPDYLALIGDASDNIPGIEGIGPKTAATLLEEYSTLDAVLAHASEIPGRKGELIRTGKESALISKKLASLDLEVSVPEDLDFYQKKTLPEEPLSEWYLQEDFSSFLKKAPLAPPPFSTEEKRYVLISDLKELEELLRLLKRQSSICIDTETTSISPREARLVGIGLGYEIGTAWYIPYNGSLPQETVHTFLQDLLSTPGLAIYGHNIKYDLHVLANEGLPLPVVDFDTLTASYLLHPDKTKHNLDDLCLTYFSHTKIPIESLIGKGKTLRSMQDVPEKEVAPYCCEDVDYTVRLKNLFLRDLDRAELLSVMNTIELPLLPVLFTMERNGMFVDLCALRELSKELTEKIGACAERIYALTGEVFNINSPRQLSEILFSKLGLIPPKKNQTGFSTSAEVLESLVDSSPVIEPLLEYRQLEKLRSTYTDALPKEVYPPTRRIHCTFSQSTAATGRLSCQNPNLQNIPIRTEEGKKIRAAFRPEDPDRYYLSGDYSQIELRLLAHFSEDPLLLEAFESGQDIHAHTAATIFHVPLQEVSEEMRRKAKAVNFGILYGQQAFGLSRGLKISYGEADRFRKMYFEKYKRVQEYIESCKEFTRTSGYARTITGRKRPIPDIHAKNPMLRGFAERLAVNTPLQGTAADLIKLAMIAIQKNLESKKTLLLLQIHDELLLEVVPEELEECKQMVKIQMESIVSLKVPLIVNISVGKNWGDC